MSVPNADCRGVRRDGAGIGCRAARSPARRARLTSTSQDGIVFQKDLGPDTAAKAEAMKTFNPDDTWKRADTSAAAAATGS